MNITKEQLTSPYIRRKSTFVFMKSDLNKAQHQNL